MSAPLPVSKSQPVILPGPKRASEPPDSRPRYVRGKKTGLSDKPGF